MGRSVKERLRNKKKSRSWGSCGGRPTSMLIVVHFRDTDTSTCLGRRMLTRWVYVWKLAALIVASEARFVGRRISVGYLRTQLLVDGLRRREWFSRSWWSCQCMDIWVHIFWLEEIWFWLHWVYHPCMA